ncbi:MAG: hypothetical protein Q4C64_02360 [Erysipelotrichia bacterium]|nr:hypothetical protein [Erysipelotrichia bacterium]
MVDLFSLVGKIIINNDEAKKNLNELTDHAEESSSKIGNALTKIGEVAVKAGKVMAVGISAGATAISFLLKQSIDAYGNYEQLVGGVETLFKDSSDKLMEYAKKAYLNQGLSANEYMETATSFSASLLQGLEGNTDKAVEYTNRAITDMSDNANKMGTDIASIQNAYQGFAKQNYTMLDNLKLGYGGTQEEMKRLIENASKMTDIQKKLGVTVDESSMSFDNIINAISVIQTSLDITGTTALEASTTIQGSINSLKGAWANLMVGLADDTQNFDELLQNVFISFETVAKNILPRVQTVLSKIPDLIKGLAPLLPPLVESLLPSLITGAIALMQGLVEAIPTLISVLVQSFPMFIDAFKELGNSILALVPQLFDGIVGGIPGMAEIWQSALNQIKEFLQPVIEKVQEWWNVISEAWTTIFPSLQEAWNALVATLQAIWDSVLSPLITTIRDIVTEAIDFIIQLIPQISETISSVLETLSNWWNEVLQPLFEVIGNYLETYILPFIKKTFNNIFNVVSAVFNGIVALWNTVLKPILEAVITFLSGVFAGDWSKIWQGIKDFVSSIFSGIFNTIKTVLSTVFNVVKTLLKQIWDNFSASFNAVFGIVSDIFGGIYDKIKEKISNAKDFVKGAIDKIKSFFKFEWSLPKLKMPHVKIDGEFSLLPPKVPKFSIDWYKEGGILKQPTLFGFNPFKNSAMVGGEAGAEAIAPISDLQGYVRSAVREQNLTIEDLLYSILELLSDYLPQLNNRNLVLDTGTLVGELSSPIDYELGVIKRRKDRQ